MTRCAEGFWAKEMRSSANKQRSLQRTSAKEQPIPAKELAALKTTNAREIAREQPIPVKGLAEETIHAKSNAKQQKKHAKMHARMTANARPTAKKQKKSVRMLQSKEKKSANVLAQRLQQPQL